MKEIVELIRKRLWWRKDLTKETLLKYAELISSHYEYELKNGEVPSLLKMNENLERREMGILQRCQQLSQKHELELQYYKRYESEALHLKDVIQEKNMVIDRLEETVRLLTTSPVKSR